MTGTRNSRAWGPHITNGDSIVSPVKSINQTELDKYVIPKKFVVTFGLDVQNQMQWLIPTFLKSIYEKLWPYKLRSQY